MRFVTAACIGLILLVVTASGSAQQTADDRPAFKHPRAVQAWNRLQFRQQKAQEAFDREMAAARAECLEGLQEAAQAVARTGNAAELKAIADAQAAAAVQGTTAETLTASDWVRLFEGQDSVHPVQFGADGAVQMPGSNSWWSSWRKTRDGIVISNRQRLTPINTTIFVGTDSNGTTIYLFPKAPFK